MHSGRMHFYYGFTETKTDGTIACAQQASAEGADAAVVIGAEGESGRGDTLTLFALLCGGARIPYIEDLPLDLHGFVLSGRVSSSSS